MTIQTEVLSNSKAGAIRSEKSKKMTMQKWVDVGSSSCSSKKENSGRPIRLVYTDECGKFKTDPEAIDALHQVKGPIGVVSVCGRSRQGKSFILNQLLGRNNGFKVASTHRSCTKGLWMWSAPLKIKDSRGADYNLLLLDSEGIDAYDQTGTYSIQIFSLAILLSSMFIYNQMGGIDEAALDRLSLVTEMSKHIRIRASGGGNTVSELGQFSPIFVWLLRDFYLDLVEDNAKLTPHDYLELALRPVPGGGKDIVAKNKIRESIQALFPDRECFTLVRPLNSETELQHLDQIPLEKLRPEFRSGLDAFTKFVFERSKPKQVDSTIMTGPILAGITKLFLDALNSDAVPTISSSWQSIEESECQRALDRATAIYVSAFDRTKPPQEVFLKEAHEEAVQKSLSAFNASAVGSGSTRQKYEVLLQNFLQKAFEDYKQTAFMAADLRCYTAVESMEKKLRAACQVPGTKIKEVVRVLDNLVAEYEASFYGPAKWQQLSYFLRKSLQDIILPHAKKQIDESSSPEKRDLILKCRTIEDKIDMLNKQLEASDKLKSEYQQHYEYAIDDLKKLSDHYKSRINSLENKCSLFDERCSSLMETIDSAKQESLEWKRKFEELITSRNNENISASEEISVFKSWNHAAKAEATANEAARSALKEANEWKIKYENAVRETKAAVEKVASVQESAKQAQFREDALRADFSRSLEEKDAEIKDKVSKLECAEEQLTALRLELEGAQSKINSCNFESSELKLQIRALEEKYRDVKSTAESMEREVVKMQQGKSQQEHKYIAELKNIEEASEECRTVEEVKMVNDLVNLIQAEPLAAENQKGEVQQLALEKHFEIERGQKYIESLEKQKMDLEGEVEKYQLANQDATVKIALLEARVKEREEEIDMLKMKNEQQVNAFQIRESVLESKCTENAGVTSQHEVYYLEVESLQEETNLLRQDSVSDFLNEIEVVPEHENLSFGKRSMSEAPGTGVDSVQDTDIDEVVRVTKKQKHSMTLHECTVAGDSDSVSKQKKGKSQPQTYLKFTVAKLREELIRHGFGAELLELNRPKKKDILALYEKHILS